MSLREPTIIKIETSDKQVGEWVSQARDRTARNIPEMLFERHFFMTHVSWLDGRSGLSIRAELRELMMIESAAIEIPIQKSLFDTDVR